jgi:hypothetical protein
VLGRQLLVNRVGVDGWKPADAAKAMGVPRQTAYKWLRRFHDEGPAGLEDRSSAPRRCAHRLDSDVVANIVAVRLETLYGPHRLAYALGRPRSTIYGVLRREGVSRRSFIDRPTRTVVRYERARPGELLHVDVKKLGRIRDGGGWRIHGRAMARADYDPDTRVGYDYLHVAVDDHSRVAFVRSLPNEKGPTCARFVADAAAFFAGHGVTIERVMTDNAMNYRRSNDFRRTLEELGIAHRRTASYRPRPTAKRSGSTGPSSKSSPIRNSSSPTLHAEPLSSPGSIPTMPRPHTAIGGLTPLERRAEHLLELVELVDRMEHRPGSMSGGQQQRVAIARALALDPPVIRADEPTAHLDYIQVEGVLNTLRQLANADRMVLIATHDERLLPLADRIVELSPRVAWRTERFSLNRETRARSFTSSIRVRFSYFGVEMTVLRK